MRKHNAIYWTFQVTGWSLYGLVYSFFYLAIQQKTRTETAEPFFFQQLTTHVVLGFLLTHVMRTLIKQVRILDLSFKKQFFYLTVISLCFSFLIGVLIVSTEIFLHIQSNALKEYSFLNIATRFAFSYFHFVLLWNLIYFTYHYIQKSRQQTIDRSTLESLLKELEIKTIKAHINPNFIFNSLNSIRSLVVDNPARARSAITQLSNIMRNSMQGDKTEKTLFEKEINVVKDYLSLEELRLDGTLQVTYVIEEDTLDQPVPPMILQTLVENALKYANGSNQVRLNIISADQDTHHAFGVKSDGNLQDYIDTHSAVINDLRNRLSDLYGKKASFTLQLSKEGLIEAMVKIPM